jgi:hypothetical protein
MWPPPQPTGLLHSKHPLGQLIGGLKHHLATPPLPLFGPRLASTLTRLSLFLKGLLIVSDLSELPESYPSFPTSCSSRPSRASGQPCRAIRTILMGLGVNSQSISEANCTPTPPIRRTRDLSGSMVCLWAVDQYITRPQELYNPKNAPKQGPLRKTSTKLCRPVIRFMRALCGICSVHCPSSAALIQAAPGTKG